jgi:hypothetical protein
MADISHSRILWKPNDVSVSQADTLRVVVSQRHGISLRNYSELHGYSVADKTIADFLVDLFIFLELKSEKKLTQSLEASVSSRCFPNLSLDRLQCVMC